MAFKNKSIFILALLFSIVLLPATQLVARGGGGGGHGGGGHGGGHAAGHGGEHGRGGEHGNFNRGNEGNFNRGNYNHTNYNRGNLQRNINAGDYSVRPNPNYQVRPNANYNVNHAEVRHDVNRALNRDANYWGGGDYWIDGAAPVDGGSDYADPNDPEYNLEIDTDDADDVNTDDDGDPNPADHPVNTQPE